MLVSSFCSFFRRSFPLSFPCGLNFHSTDNKYLSFFFFYLDECPSAVSTRRVPYEDTEVCSHDPSIDGIASFRLQSIIQNGVDSVRADENYYVTSSHIDAEPITCEQVVSSW